MIVTTEHRRRIIAYARALHPDAVRVRISQRAPRRVYAKVPCPHRIWREAYVGDAFDILKSLADAAE